MYTLLSGAVQRCFAKRKVNILVLGLDNAGKTTLLERVKVNGGVASAVPSRIPPTVGLNVARVSVGRRTEATWWDLGGQRSLRVIWDKYFADAHAVVWVLDVSAGVVEGDGGDVESGGGGDGGGGGGGGSRWAEASAALAAVLAHPALDRAPLLVLANKIDSVPTEDVGTAIRAARKLAGAQSDRRVNVIASSGMTGLGVREASAWLVDAIAESGRLDRVQNE
jgi:ADP-ribosylation factor related protein 1